MSRAKSLIDLLSAVEAGRVGQFQNLDSQFGHGNGIIAKRAYNGSLDAAKALHDAVLPGWEWLIGKSNAKIFPFNDTHDVAGCYGMADTAARAWLIAVIKALIYGDKNAI